MEVGETSFNSCFTLLAGARAYGARYGVSIVRANPDIFFAIVTEELYASSYYIALRDNGTPVYIVIQWNVILDLEIMNT